MPKNVKRVLALAVALAFCLSAGPALAEMKIGLVDIQRALNETEKGKKTKEQLSKRVEKMQADLKLKKDELDKLEADLRKQGAVLSGDAKRDKERDFDRKKRDFTDLARDYQEEIQRAEFQATQPILKELEATIEKIGKDQGYTIIMESKMGGVIYSAKGVDITDEVIKAHDAIKK